MEIFYAYQTDDAFARLDPEESAHCVRVLRHRAGDEITVVDGFGNMLKCRLADDSPKGASAVILENVPHWGGHPYSLTMAVCPTKNNDRFEWFVEKATELGVDVIVPVIGERSERKVFKADRSRKIALSAMKQSLKAKLPVVEDPVSVKEFIMERSSSAPERECLPDPLANDSKASSDLKMICYCFDDDTPRRLITDVLSCVKEGEPQVTVLIGPEGDFSQDEARLAVSNGFIPVSLGSSRLRTETAGVTAATACYLAFPSKE